MKDLVDESQGKIKPATQMVNRRNSKAHGLTEMVKFMSKDQSVARARVVQMKAGVDITKEKQQVSRVLESRLSQIRKAQENFSDRVFNNRSFSIVLENDLVLCGSVLTRNDKIDNGDTYTDECLDVEIKGLRPSEAMIQVKVIEKKEISFTNSFRQNQKLISLSLKERVARLRDEDGINSTWKIHQESFSIALAGGGVLVGAAAVRMK